ncbi:MAG: peptide deformylase [Armatimonadetes bacterium]|nr:peptide deformylase [Armatimonadota bacterium]
MRREIVLYGDPVLRQRCKPVSGVDGRTQRLIDDMLETMRAAEGLGLAAPQVAVARRVLVAHDGDCEPIALVNPTIRHRAGRVDRTEGCLSLPGLQGSVTRARKVVVSGLDRAGRAVTIEAEDLLARVFQHEIDHLNGVLFVDHTQDLWWLDVDDDAPTDEDGHPVMQRVPTTLADVEAHFAAVRADLAEQATGS